MSARFSRLGMDTRTAIGVGTLETRVEGDFAGGSTALASPYLFRLRQAWGEYGTEQFRVLVGQANSLWNEDVYETVNFATNLNQSFVRQPQIRATATLAPGLTGKVSLEMPNTQYTSVAGVFTTTSTPGGFGGLSPAFSLAPDLLGRLEYSKDGLVLDMRGLLRDLSIHTAGTSASPPSLGTTNAAGWGVAADAVFPMRWLWGALGADELSGMAYYGEGIGRYFDSNTVGQDALSNIGLPGVTNNFSLDPLPTYGASIAYRRFWMPELRSNFVYSYAWQNYPSYALLFVPGSAAATGLNTNMEQAIVNLIWSPFAVQKPLRWTPGGSMSDLNIRTAIATCLVAMLQRSPPAPAMPQQTASTEELRHDFSRGSNFSLCNWCLRIAAKPAEPSSVVLDGGRRIIDRQKERSRMLSAILRPLASSIRIVPSG
jgi:hypothetical protein